MAHLNLDRLKKYPLAFRKSKVRLDEFAKPLKKGASLKALYESLPSLLAAKSIRDVVQDVVAARRRRRPVIVMMGAHVVKCGLGPIIIDLMKRNVITAVATNGACIIHDFELAYSGSTSEDVASAIEDGSFGMARETAEYLNPAIVDANNNGLGLGEGIGKFLQKGRFRFKGLSIFYNCAMHNIPATVHVAIGADTLHMHPSCDGAAVGECSLRDFRKFAGEVARLEGGVLLNIGSAVIMPEVFLKALAVARNLGHKVRNFTTVTFDMLYQYRPLQNVVARPTTLGGRGYYIIGHHEIMVPLLAAAIIENL